MQAITEAISPASSSSSPWRLPMGKRKTKSRPTSIVHDDNDDAASAYTIDSAKTTASGSLFASLFAKKGLHAKYSKDYASTHDLSSSSGPKPSRSTPIAPFNRSPRMWLQQDRKKRHSSDFVDKQGNEQLPPPSLPLPELATTPNNGDYFDLGSVGASDLLLKESSSRYSVLRKSSHVTKETPAEKSNSNNEKRSSIVSKLSVTHDSENVTHTSTQTKVNDAMDTLAKVLEEAEPVSPPLPESTSGLAAEPEFVPPPRKQSMPKRHSKKDSHDSATVVADEEDRRSTPLVPSNSNNNGQGLSSFWRSHTFSTRRTNQQRSSKKKQEPSLPPLNLQNSSSTRTRSSSNASATSRKSAASSSSPTSVSSPSSQTSSRNGWSSFDMQSRPNTLLFSASMPSLVLSPKERTQFSSSEPKIDPAVFMGSPEPHAGVNDLPLTQRILRCLVDGGHLTDRLYVPKQLW
ncbi:hypothetical protein BJV82DRAFT_253122 [Fennellomyces sp. T-0311]|nr:hypothetical protein BJV82DRAFT_253122 [Fennellomyces sp. T-0311]